MRGTKKCRTIIYRLKNSVIPYTTVFSDIINHKQLLQKSNRIYESSECCHRFSAIYVSDVIYKLSASGRGCHVDGIYIEVLMYNADDLLLISSTYSDLREVTKICEDEMK